MNQPWWMIALMALSATAAGMVNALAGGGTLLTFPVLVPILGPIFANGTSTAALMPGSLASVGAFRRELRQVGRWPWLLLVPSLLGGFLGAKLVTALDKSVFEALIPWLILSATLLFLLQPLLGRLKPAGHSDQPRSAWSWAGLVVGQFVIAIYGGYFGAGIGILMLAALGLVGVADIHQMNAVKTLQATAINVASITVFAIDGIINWPIAAIMAVAAIFGGYVGAHYGRRLNKNLVRGLVILIGFTLAVQYFVRRPATVDPRPAVTPSSEREASASGRQTNH